jgi:hypothetical protein
MRMRQTNGGLVAGVLLIAGLAMASVGLAHDEQRRGTVIEVQADRLHVSTVDAEGRPGEGQWFAVTAETKVQRGDRVVAYADAGIANGERVVVIVDTHARVQNAAKELRLAAK